MPATQEDYKKIEEARKRQAQATREYGKLTGAAQTFADEVMSRVRKARAERGVSKLATEMGEVTSQLVTEGPKIRQRLADVNPLQTDVLTARQRAQTLGTLTTLSQLEKERAGTIEDIIGAGTNRLLAEAATRKAEAEAAANEVATMIDLIRLKEEQAKRAFDEWVKRQQLETPSFLERLLGGAQITEPQPNYTPVEGEGAVSEGGQWVFSGNQWVPRSQAGGGFMSVLTPEVLAAGVASGEISPSAAKFLGQISGAVPSTSQQKKLDQLAVVENNVLQLETLLKNLPTGLRAAGETALTYIPFFDFYPNVKTYNALRKAFTGPVARVIAAEVGVLTDKDIARVQDILPSITDGPETRQWKMNAIKKAIENLKMGRALSPEGRQFLKSLGMSDDGFIPD